MCGSLHFRIRFPEYSAGIRIHSCGCRIEDIVRIGGPAAGMAEHYLEIEDSPDFDRTGGRRRIVRERADDADGVPEPFGRAVRIGNQFRGEHGRGIRDSALEYRRACAQ